MSVPIQAVALSCDARDEENIVRRAIALLEKTEAGARPVRLLGVSVHNLWETPFVAPEDPQPRLPFEMATRE